MKTFFNGFATLIIAFVIIGAGACIYELSAIPTREEAEREAQIMQVTNMDTQKQIYDLQNEVLWLSSELNRLTLENASLKGAQ
jgi:hypothetical protein